MSQILKCSVKWCETTSKNCTENGEDIIFHT
ncbi:THAP domain-containing protein 2, partial [Danaus plexippus plexippus]